MCDEFPLHDDVRIVKDKLVFISRVYSVSRGLGGRWGELSTSLYNCRHQIDEEIAERRRHQFINDVASVVKVHGMLNQIVCKTLGVHGHVAHGRASFSSKYLHFHAPDAFPIFDTLSWAGLRALTPGFRSEVPQPAPYHRFCERLSHYIGQGRAEQMSLREIDTILVQQGREGMA
ncbi:hypothetical protein [Sandaracinobacteroides hominis]|uniref:hypothetical protein n=1 Tax=Sandaracinobacteroides hominis TaxID=2780086 RepID=UPI0018F3C9A9|nr:hypothetical protein [Sandaracinobacteroides hominis]